MSPPSPPPANASERSRETERAKTWVPAPAVFGPAPNPNQNRHSKDKNTERDGEELEEEEGFLCRVCGERVKSVSEEQHVTSTLHIFNQKHRPQERKVSRQSCVDGNRKAASSPACLRRWRGMKRSKVTILKAPRRQPDRVSLYLRVGFCPIWFGSRCCIVSV